MATSKRASKKSETTMEDLVVEVIKTRSAVEELYEQFSGYGKEVGLFAGMSTARFISIWILVFILGALFATK